MTAGEQDALHVARAAQEQCVCGETHETAASVPPAAIARAKAYLAANPDHRFAVDDETGIVAVIISPGPGTSEPLRVIAQSSTLVTLLDAIGAPPAASLS